MSLTKAREIARQKDRFIEKRRQVLASSITALQKRMLTRIIDRVISKLELEEGNIKRGTTNMALSAEVDKVFKEAERDIAVIMKGVVSDYAQLTELNRSYYSSYNKALSESVAKTVERQMNLRIGINSNGEPMKDGFIDSFIKDKTVARNVKNTVLSAVMNGTPIRNITTTLTDVLTGTDKAAGALERHFKTYLYDTYSQFDSETGNAYAVQLDLNYGLYEGGLVEDSRPFCVERNGKVFTREEVQAFGTSKDKFGGYVNKKEGLFQGKNKDYVPERDRGGYNCGHYFNWVTYAIARSIRPDIPRSKFDKKTA